jgi:hypothetical protein
VVQIHPLRLFESIIIHSSPRSPPDSEVRPQLCWVGIGTRFAAILLASASNPKTTGDADWRNPYSGQETNLTFTALATKPTGVGAKGSAIYTDPNVTYTIDVQFVQVSGNTA